MKKKLLSAVLFSLFTGLVLCANAEGENADYSRFFERFYRKDEAHTISAGTVAALSAESSGKRTNRSGYGIGLSIAESLVKSMKGSIDVSWNTGQIHFICKF